VFVYSNPAVNVAGYVAEAVAGIPFAELVRQRVFEPLEMTRSTFDPLVAMTYPLAQAHRVDDDGRQTVVRAFSDNGAAHPSGGIYSTALDMANYARMLMQEGRWAGREVLRPRELAEMTRPHTRTFWPTFTPTSSYGLMLFVGDYKGRRRWGHPGGAGGFLHTFELMPDTRSAVILQTNGGGGTFAGLQVADEVFDELLGLPRESTARASEPDRSSWPAYAGAYAADSSVYEGAKPLGTVVVDVEGDGLVARWNGTTTLLEQFAPDFYRAAPDGSSASSSDSPGLVTIGFYRKSDEPVEWASINMQPARRVGAGR
jgi:CubicO group peptidase (beta-lactamase class C family)